MDINTFIDNFAAQFDDTDRDRFSPETEFKNLDEWCSLMALSIIAMVDEEYGVTIVGNDIKGSVTIKDLFDKVAAKA